MDRMWLKHVFPVVMLGFAALSIGRAQKSIDLPFEFGMFTYSPDGKYFDVREVGGPWQESLVRISDGKILLLKVQSLQFSTDGNFAAAIEKDSSNLGRLVCIDLQTGKVSKTNAKGNACAISPDGSKVALSDSTGSFVPFDRKARSEPSVQIFDRKTGSSRRLRNFLKDLVLNTNGLQEAGGTHVGPWTPDGLEISYSYPLSAGIARARIDVNKDRVTHKFPWYANNSVTLADGSTIMLTKQGLFLTSDLVRPQKQIFARKDWPEDFPYVNATYSSTSNVVAVFGTSKDGTMAGVWALNAVSRKHARLAYSKTARGSKQNNVIFATPSPDGKVIAHRDFLKRNRIDFDPVPQSVRWVTMQK